jgi:acetyl esterase/lipase
MGNRPRRVRLSVVAAAAAATALACTAVLVSPTSAGAREPAVLSSAALPALVIGSGQTTIRYCDQSGVTETLAIDEPNPLPTTPVPAVVYIHGGGWVQGDSALSPGSLVGQVAQEIEAKGWVFVSIDYRLAPRFRWPAQIEDAACAVRFLRAAAVTLHVDPGAIGAMGDSAGGQIASLLGLAGPAAGFEVGQDLNQSSTVQAVVDLFGPTDLTTPDWLHAQLIQSYAPEAFGTTLGPGTPGSAATDGLEAASPLTYVGAHDPPFLIIQGDDDTVVPADQSTELASRLRAVGNSATLVLVSHAQHGLLPVTGGVMTPGLPALAQQAAAFLIRTLGSADAASRKASAGSPR